MTMQPGRAPAPRASVCGSRRSSRAGDERGSSVVEFTILFPIIVGLLLAGPQIAMWEFARQAAEAAAQAGARAASVDGAPAGAGKAVAEIYLSRVASGTITSKTVTEQDGVTTVTIHIHATVPNVIPLPGFTPTLDVTVVRGKERFTTPASP
jgi:Flp pilus assembly protein TadG